MTVIKIIPMPGAIGQQGPQGEPGQGGGLSNVEPVHINDQNGDLLLSIERTGTNTTRINAVQDDLSLRSSRDITLFAGSNGPGNVYIGWGDAQYTPNSQNRVATIGDINNSLPQPLTTSDSPTFDKVYTTNNGSGTNIQVGDDAWIGDVNLANHIAIKGVETETQGGIVLGSSLTEKISSDGNNLSLNANGTIYMNQDVAMNNYTSFDFKDDADNNTATIYSNPNLNIFAYNNANIEANGSMTIRANGGDMNFYMDGTAYVGDSVSGHRIVLQQDLANIPTTFASGAFHDETSFGPYSANSEQALSYQSTDWSSDVRIAGINNSEITFDRTGKFNIAYSTQFHVTSGGAVVYVWLKKNGITVPWSGTRCDITANNPYYVAAWNWFVDVQANDYYEIFWSTPAATVKVESISGLTGTKATVPSNILTVNQVG